MTDPGAVREYDYAVAGAGPAGSLAALSLRRQGYRVLLLDWRPREEKSCGGGVPALGMRRFGHLLEGVARNAALQLRLVGPRGDRVEIDLAEPLAIFSRRELDGALRRRATAAGAERVAARLVSWQRREDGLLLRGRGRAGEEVRAGARFLVAADGACGSVRTALLRELGHDLPRDPRQFSRSFNTYPRIEKSRTMELAWLPDTDGYAWTFPRTDHASVGICEQGLAGGSAGLARDLRGLVEAERLTGRRGEPGVGAPIPSLRRPFAPQPVEGPHFALVGDAAGAVDPITREGIHYAMMTGWALGDSDPLARPGAYHRWFQREVRPELEAAAAWAPRFFDEAFLTAMVRALAASRTLRAVFRDLVAGRQSYRGLRWRLLANLPLVLPALLRAAGLSWCRRVPPRSPGPGAGGRTGR